MYCSINVLVKDTSRLLFKSKSFFKKSFFLLRKDILNGSKVTVKTFIMLQKCIFQINAVLSSKNQHFDNIKIIM